MKKIKLTCVGEIKSNDEYSAMIALYTKRIEFYCDFVRREITEPNYEDSISVLNDLKNDMSKNIHSDDLIICLDQSGQQMSSSEFAKLLEMSRAQTPHFMIGGSKGLPKEFLRDAKKVVSFSDMTFPYKLFRVMFLEQLYRAFTIINNQSYHK